MNQSDDKNDSESEKSDKKKSSSEEDPQKWFAQGDLQDLAKFGGDILKKTVATGIDVIKEVKDNFPKEATQLISKGKDELIKGLTQDMAKNLISFGIEKFFAAARQHDIQLTLKVKKNENEVPVNSTKNELERKYPKKKSPR